jgi:hypothetical protein
MQKRFDSAKHNSYIKSCKTIEQHNNVHNRTNKRNTTWYALECAGRIHILPGVTVDQASRTVWYPATIIRPWASVVLQNAQYTPCRLDLSLDSVRGCNSVHSITVIRIPKCSQYTIDTLPFLEMPRLLCVSVHYGVFDWMHTTCTWIYFGQHLLYIPGVLNAFTENPLYVLLNDRAWSRWQSMLAENLPDHLQNQYTHTRKLTWRNLVG